MPRDGGDGAVIRQPGEFAVATAVNDGHAVLNLAGELDCASAPRLREALDDLRARHVSTLRIDLAQLSFIDSSGLNELVVALKRQREAGGDVVLQSPSPQAMRVLEIVGLTQVFTIV